MSLAPSLKAIYRWLQPDIRSQAATVYSQLMAQARHPWFYHKAGVPDTLDGRFEMLVLHLWAFISSRGILPRAALSPTLRASPCSDDAQSEFSPTALSRALLELTIDDMDQALREMGVGDMGVSRRIKQMGNAMNGRFHAYAAGLAEGTLADALARNAYGTVTPEAISPEAVELLQDYTLRMVAHLQAQAAEKIDLSGLLMPDIIKA